MARHFQENGMKLLLEDPRNVRDLLALTGHETIPSIDFDRVRPLPQTFVTRDYRHVEADVVLMAPVRGPAARPRRVWLYILIEHQSQPDPTMPLRILDYVVQIYRFQARRWDDRHPSRSGLRLQPVLPVVFHTGSRRWEQVGRLVDRVEGGERFRECIPVLDPLFLNLPAIAPQRLETEGGFFGWVLALVQGRKKRPRRFRQLLVRVIRALEAMPERERMRWLTFLSYIHALVYHERSAAEQPELRLHLDASAATDVDRQEVVRMVKTYAEVVKEEVCREMARAILIRQLGRRFGEVPDELVAVIQTTTDLGRLNGWLDLMVTSETLEAIGIG